MAMGQRRKIFCGNILFFIPHKQPFLANNSRGNAKQGEETFMKATGIVRRVDDLGRIVIPKEIRRTLRIREGDPSQTTWNQWERFCFAMLDLSKRTIGKGT